MNDKDNLYTKDYPDYNPIFKNRLDKLKFLCQKYRLDFNKAKTKSKDVLIDFLNISIIFIEEEINETELHLLTKKYHKTIRKKYIEACTELNFLKKKFNNELIDLGKEPTKAGFGIYEKSPDENIEYFSNFDEIEKEFRNGIKDFPERSANRLQHIFNGNDDKGDLLFRELFFNGKIKKGERGFKDYIGYMYWKMFKGNIINAKEEPFKKFINDEPFDAEIEKIKSDSYFKLNDKKTAESHKHFEFYQKKLNEVYSSQK